MSWLFKIIANPNIGNNIWSLHWHAATIGSETSMLQRSAARLKQPPIDTEWNKNDCVIMTSQAAVTVQG